MPKRTLAALLSLLVLTGSLYGQDRLATMPGYERWRSIPNQLRTGFVSGSIRPSWKSDSSGFAYSHAGKNYSVDVATLKVVEVSGGEASEQGALEASDEVQDRGQAPRGRQYPREFSPDGKWRSTYQNRNVWIGPRDGDPTVQVTQDGTDANRVKSGTATWVYGEELGQKTAMWWSPDSKRLAYYRFDESKVPDYFLTTQAGGFKNGLYVEPYAKAGADNPLVDLYIYELDSKKITKIDVRDGRAFDEGPGHYVYGVEWSPDGSRLWFRRMNRLQSVMQWCSADPATGAVSVMLEEKWPTWVEQSPQRIPFQKGQFFLMSERTGFSNVYLYENDFRLVKAVTQEQADVESVVRADVSTGNIFYTARTGDNAHKVQLHVTNLKTGKPRQLTDPKFTHATFLSPDMKWFVDVAETTTEAPVARLVSVATGKPVLELTRSNLSKFDSMGGQRVERFTYLAGDGVTTLFGKLHKPSNFDPNKKYPTLVGVYNGPESSSYSERFELPDGLTELGFLVVEVESRGQNGRGKKFRDAAYGKLGVVEIDDIALGIKSLWNRSYFDKQRVGVHGTSYGGYASIMCLLRHPNVFHAAVASSSVTDWRHYDTIYTERYMGTPASNPDGYAAGSAMAYASKLEGWLMLFFGTMDDNVHPANTYQLITALNRAGKSYDLNAGPDQGHAGLNFQRTLEYFIERLVLFPHKRLPAGT